MILYNLIVIYVCPSDPEKILGIGQILHSIFFLMLGIVLIIVFIADSMNII